MTTRPVENLEPIALPAPVLDGGRTLLEALKMRRTSRDISGEKIPLQALSDILWAAQGVNRATGPFGDPGERPDRQATQGKFVSTSSWRRAPTCTSPSRTG